MRLFGSVRSIVLNFGFENLRLNNIIVVSSIVMSIIFF